MLKGRGIMTMIDSSNAGEHSYPVYGRQFKSYRWYKPVIAAVLFIFFYLLLAVMLFFGVAYFIGGGTLAFDLMLKNNVFTASYDDMDLANAWQSVLGLGSVAVMIPALWLTSVIVRDRPFSSYSSARGGWSSKVFWKAFPIAFICISVPIAIKDIFFEHDIKDFEMKYTLIGLAVVTVLGPLQCIAEEYAFRGLLMQTFGSWFRLPAIAVIFSSAVFASMHPYDMIGKIGILVSGLVFAVTAWIGRGIEVSSAFHICNNMTIFYLQGMNLSTISTESKMSDLIFEICTGAAFIALIYIASRRHNWFNSIRRDDLAAWNQKIDEKVARKEAKKAAKAEKKAEQTVEIAEEAGAHEESAPGKHFKQ